MGVVGGGILAVAPRWSLRAFADGSTPATGVWSAGRHPTSGDLVGLVGSTDGPTVHALDVDSHGLVRVGARHTVTDMVGFVPVAVGVGTSSVVVGTGRPVPAPVTDPGPALLDPAARALVETEPDHPYGAGTVVDERPVPLVVEIVSGSVDAPPTAGVVTGTLGVWTVRQHGPDGDADHLSMLSVSTGGRETLLFDDLHDATSAQLVGPAATPVLTVADGDAALRVHLPDRSLTAPPLADTATTTVTRAGDDVLATSLDAAGRVVVSLLSGHRWNPVHTLAGTESSTGVLGVVGSSEVLVTGPAGTAVHDLDGLV